MAESCGHPWAEATLDNGLTAYFYDRSRTIAGDRAYVELFIVVPVPIEADYFRHCTDPKQAHETFVAAQGPVVHFEQKRIRHFVPGDDTPAVLRQLHAEFLKTSLVYLGKEGFPEKFVLKKWREWVLEEERQRAHSAAVARVEPPSA